MSHTPAQRDRPLNLTEFEMKRWINVTGKCQVLGYDRPLFGGVEGIYLKDLERIASAFDEVLRANSN